MTIDSAARPTALSLSGLRVLLLGGSALAMLTSGAVSAAGLPTQLTTDLSNVGAGSLNTQVLNAGVATAGTAAYMTRSATGLTANVALTAPRTLIDWTSFDVTSGNTVNFNFAGSAADVVLNRVTGGAITVETGGAVNGVFNGKTGGNIWFLADGGVFIHGTVTASGVLATRNTAVADLNLLSDNIATLKTELSAASSLIDMSGVVVASGAEIDLNGNIVLSGDINTGAAGAVNLTSTGSVSQTAGAITAASLTGSSVGGASLPDANVFDSLAGFVNTAGGNVAINDASALTVTGAAINFDGAGDLTLTTKGALTLAAPVRAPVGTVALNADGVIAQSSGFIQAVSLSGSSKGGATLTSATNAITNTLGVFANSGTGNIILTNKLFLNVVGPVTAPNGRFVLNAPTAVLPIQGASDLSVVTEAGQPGSIVAQTLNGGVVATGTDNYTSDGTTATITLGAVPRTLIDWTSFTVGPTNTVNFKFTGTVSDIVINRVTGGAITVDGVVNGHFGAGVGGGVWFLADGGVFLNGAVSASGILGGNNTSLTALALVQNDLSVLKSAFGSGGESLFDIEAVGTATASASQAQINIGGSIQLLGAVDAAASGSVVLASGQVIAQTSTSVIHAASLSGSATQSVILTGANQFDTLAGFTQNGVGQLTIIDAKTTGLTVSGAVSAGANNNLTLTSAGSLAINAPVTVGGDGAVSLNYKASAPTNLGFGDAGSVTFTNADGTAATTSQGGSLTINAQPYTLLYGLALGGSTGPDAGIEDLAGIDTNTAAGGDTGFYALATNLTGTGTAAAPQFTGALAGAGANSFTGVLEGLGHTVAGLTIGDTGVNTADAIGLIGANVGTVRDIGLVSGAVSGGEFTGSLVGFNSGSIVQAYASAAVSNARNNGGAGGLVGSNSGAISQSYASGPVTGLQNAYTGGLVGLNAGAGTITQVYATGASTGGQFAGGLVGMNTGAVAQAYATGAVSGATASAGGLIGNQATTGTVASSAYDTLTTGQGDGIGVDQNNQQGNVAALTSAQLQGALPSGFDTAAWATGAGLYPFLTAAHPNGVQAVSGVAYTDMGVTPLASGANGAVLVNLTVNGLAEGAVTTGANGYYYFALPAGAVGGTTPSLLLATIAANAVTGAQNAAGLTSATGTTGGLNLYGGDLLFTTSATTYSTSGFPVAAPTALSFATTPGFVAGLTDFIQATGASFTIDAPIAQANGFGVQTTAASAPITVSKDITLTGGSPLTLISSGGLAVNANLTTAAGPVTLVSGGAITGDTATITAGTLTGSSVGGASFNNSANAIVTFGGFNDTDNGNVTLVDSQGLTVRGVVNIGTGALTLTSTGAISGDTAAITAATLTVSSAGGLSLAGANKVSNLASLTNTGAGGISFNDNRAITIDGGSVSQGAGGLTLSTTQGNLTVTGALNAGLTHTLTLRSTGAIAGDTATITAGTLTGGSVGGASFTNAANALGTFGPFKDTGDGNVTVVDNQGLAVAGAVNIGTGTLTLTTAGAITGDAATITAGILTGSSTSGASFGNTANAIGTFGAFADTANGDVTVADGQDLKATGAVDIGSGTLTLISTGAITGDTATITAGTLMGSSVGGASFNNKSNLIGTFGAFGDTGHGDVTVVDGQGLAVMGTVNIGSGTLTLTSTGAIAGDAATITAGALSGSSKGGASFNNKTNAISAFGAFKDASNGYVTLADSRGLTVAGEVDIGSGTLTLASLGVISADTATITAGTLAGSSVGGASFNSSSNLIEAFELFTNTSGGDVVLKDRQALTVAGLTNKAGNVSLTTQGAGSNLTLDGDLTVGRGLTLASAGTVSQTSGAIIASNLTGSSTGGASVTGPNQITTLTGFTNRDAGAILLVNDIGLAVTGIIDNIGGAPGGAGRDIGVTLTDGSLTGNGVFTAGRDVAIAAANGSLSFATATAGDDLVLRATAGVAVPGALTATGLASGSDAADTTATGDMLVAGGPIRVFGQAYQGLTDGSHIDVRTSGGDVTLGALAAATGDVRLQALAGSVHTADVSADRSIVIDAALSYDAGAAAFNTLGAGGDVAVQTGTGPLALGAVTASGDIVLRSAGGSVSLASASAGDDLLIRAGSDVLVAGALSSGTGSEVHGLADVFLANLPEKAMVLFGHTYGDLTKGSAIDIVAGAGLISLGDAAQAKGGDIRLQASAGSIGYKSLTAEGDIGLDAVAAIKGGNVEASGDLAIRGGDLSIGALTAAGDVVLRASGNLIVTGTIASGTGADRFAAAGDNLSIVSPLAIFESPEPTLSGGVTDIGAAGAVEVTGAITAGFGPTGALTQSLSDIRIVSASADHLSSPALQTLGVLTASGDVALDAPNGGIAASGAIIAGRDVAARAGVGALGLISVSAGDDIVLGANTTITVTGALTGGTLGEAVGLGDTLADAGPMTVFLPKTVQTYATDSDGSQIDMVSGGDITVGGLASSTSDVRLQSISGAIHVVDITAGRDILLDAQTTVNAGAIIAAQDVAVSAAAGDLTLVSASAGDDIVARSGRATKVAGALTAGTVGEGRGAGDYLVQAVSMNAVGHQFAGVADGSTIDIVSQGGVVLGGAAVAPNGDVRLQSLGGAIHTTGIVAGRDIVIDAAANVTVGPTVTDTLGAGADIAILAGSGGITLTSATAGGDVVLRAASGVITVAGSLDSGTRSLGGYSGAGTYLTASAPLHLFGVNETVLGEGSTDIGAQSLSVNAAIIANGAGAGVRIVTAAADIPGAPALHVFGAVTAGGDVALDSQGGSILIGGALAAAGDIAIWGEKGSVSLLQAQAGDDALIRAAATVSVTGGLSAGSLGESSGAADRLLAANPSQSIALFGQTQAGLADGSHVDVAARSVSVGGAVTASGTGSDVRIAAMGADPSNMTALSVVGPVNAGRDVALDAVAGSITLGGSTIAGRDVAARSLIGNITMTSVMAGSDVVLSTPVGGVKLNGSVTASGAPTSPGPGPGKTLFDRVSAPLDGLFTLASGSIVIGANTYANAGYTGNPSANLTAGTAIGLALADTRGLSLADANPHSGSWVKASALVAPTVTLFESKGPISIGYAKLDSKVVSINIYDMAGVTVTGAFTPATNDTVALTIGAPDPATLTGATAANIGAAKDWTPSVIEVVNDTTTTNQRGSIGMMSVNGSGVYSTTPVIFQKATLNATTNILLGTKAFVDANASVTDIAGLKRINPLLPVPIVSANTSKAIMLAVGDLSLSAGRMIVQQNTTGLRTTEGTGYYVTRTLTLGSYLTNPPAIDLFGVFTKLGTAIPITGASTAVSNQIFLVGTLASSEFRSLYRVNGCVIGELGNCTPISDGITSIPRDELGRGALLSRDELDVEDPTITGAPNEEIWRRPDDRP